MYNVSISPHVRDKSSTQKIMIDVAIALIPTLGFGVYRFGLNSLMLILVSAISCVAFEACYEFLAKKPITVFDGSALVTGLILAVNLPPPQPGGWLLSAQRLQSSLLKCCLADWVRTL
jgi:electron transport complex protein RnfD